jgi:glutamine amidotransferase-like uncharacterized protein
MEMNALHVRGRIALFVHHPRCSIQSVNGIIKSLEDHYVFKTFTKHEIEDDFFDDVDIVCFAGGIGDSDAYDFLFRDNGNSIRKYVQKGGRYLGICMGAYWADKHYFNLLGDVVAEQYIKRPKTCTRRYYSKGIECNWNGTNDRFFFYDGPAFIGNESNFETIARYTNNDPAAIIKGRIGLVGPHLESQEFWYDKPYLHKYWHKDTHGKLLLDFVDRLMEK